MEHMITCINCPVGCRMQVTVEDGEVKSVTGNSCNRGLIYAKQECVAPMRMVTACMQELGKQSVEAPVKLGQVICPNVCGTGVDVIATKQID